MREYLETLGRLFYLPEEEIAGYWAGVAPERRRAFLARAVREDAGAFVLWRLGGQALDDRTAAALSAARDQAMLTALCREAEMRRLADFLTERGIRFVPFKGADLAYRVYPSPSLRLFSDVDIFFHPEDIDRARKELLADGWREEGHLVQAMHHHYAPMFRGMLMMEPHWRLPCFQDASPEDIWKHIRPVSGSQHILSPELNLLALARHASEKEYRCISLTKLLLDCAMVIQHDGCDWRQLRVLCTELRQPYAGNLLAAFPEFFPAEMIGQMGADAASSAAYRRIFKERNGQRELNTSQVTVICGGITRLQWWQRRLCMLHPVNVRRKYNLPAAGVLCRLASCYLREVAMKSWQFARYTFCPGNSAVNYMALIARAEKN